MYVKHFIPLTLRFQDTKWKRPVNEEIRKHIMCKKSLWRKYIRDKNISSWLQYTKQRSKVKKATRNDIKEQQNAIAQQCKANPKYFGNMLTPKTKDQTYRKNR